MIHSNGHNIITSSRSNSAINQNDNDYKHDHRAYDSHKARQNISIKETLYQIGAYVIFKALTPYSDK